ncbi:MAG: recombinase family protein [Veillonellales bacterium]
MDNKRNTSLKDLEPACFYLRKSREDQEAEARGEGETLAKHKKALFRLAKEYGVAITKVFEEIVSGESLIHRPEMLELLKEVESGSWKSVFCMDIDRLGRGGMQDQGLIIETFKNTNTKIVTPRKIYDLNDEFDEEYTEFEAFMARKELKIITRRLQGGRLRSVEDGNYLGTVPPYGYQIEKKDRSRYLVKNPEQSTAAALIWKLYQQEDMGTNKIANELNRLGYVSYTGKNWSASSILSMLKNPVYAGVIAWKKKEQKKSAEPGKKRDTKSRPRSEQIWIYDAHEPYISLDEFHKVQDKLKKKYHPPFQLINGLANPLAGLIKCELCGLSMVYRPYSNQRAHLICYNRHCHNKSSRFEYVEDAVISGLEHWLNQYRAQWDANPQAKKNNNMACLKEKELKKLQKERNELARQKDNLHDLLEKKVYDIETYLDRSKKLSERITNVDNAISETETSLANEIMRRKAQKSIMPKVKNLLDIYRKATSPEAKNKLLKSVLEYATYLKEPNQKGRDFSLVLHPKLPQ